MAKKSKRVLSVLLTLVMILGLLPTSAFAYDNSRQVGSYVGYDAATGQKTGEQYATAEEATQVLEKDGVTMQKNISAAGTENLFNIDLIVTTQEQLEEVPMSPDAAVVLVIDSSYSMNYNDDGCDAYCKENHYKSGWYPIGTTISGRIIYDYMSHEQYHDGSSYFTAWPVESERRITKAKTAASNFVDDFMSDAGDATRLVSVVSFNGKGYVNQGWTESAADAKRAISQITTDSSTNIEDGLQEAYDLLGRRDVQGIKSKYVILLTDGAPTKSNQSSHSVREYAEDAAAVAQKIRVDRQATLYTLAYAVADETLYETRNEKVTVGQWLENDVASKDCAYNATTGDEISISLDDIMETISKLMQAWQVTDPMGTYMKVPTVTSEKEKDVVTVTGNGTGDGSILWNLWLDTPEVSGSSPKTYTYKLSYQVELDTAIKGFKEDTYYETNKPTSLKYAVDLVNDDGSLNVSANIKTAYFNIPTVEGEIPEYEYHVEYYLQGEAEKGDYKNYEPEDSSTPVKADLHSTQTILVNGTIPENIKNKYNSEFYHCAGADPASVTITNDPAKNVIKVYYDHDTVDVTVNHFYKTITIFEDNTSNEDTVDYEGPYPVTYEDCNVGEEFTAEKMEYLDGVKFTFEEKNSDPLTIDELGNEDEVINLRYVRTVDRRNKANILEQYVLVDKAWELNEQGKYELESTPSDPYEVYHSKDDPNANWREFDPYTAKVDKPDVIPDGYTFDHAEATNGIVEGTQAKTILAEGDNTLTLYYEKELPDTREPATVTIRHFYTMDRTYIENGEVKHEQYTKVEDTDAAVTVTEGIYVGESFTAGAESLKTEYDGFQFTPDASNDYKLEKLSSDPAENVINIYYTYSGSTTPDETTITVIHEYYDATKVYNEETDEIEIDYEPNDELTKEISYPNAAHPLYNVLYVGQKFEAPLNPVDGYEFNEAKSDERVVNALAATNDPITLRYYETDPDEGRDEASIAVRHTYKTNWTVANPSGLGTTVRPDTDAQSVERDPDLDNYSGHQGDPFTPTPNPTYDGKDYQLTSGNAGEVKLTAPGSNGTIPLVYERSDSDLTSATYTVTHHYNLRTMSVVNGTAQWSDWQEVGTSENFTINGGQQLPKELYVGNTFTVDKAETFAYDLNGDGVAENLTFTMGGNPGLTVKVDSETGHLDINYYYSDELPQAPVRVRHEYTEHKFLYSPSGVEIEDTNVTYNPSSSNWIITWHYVGETVQVDPLPLDYTYSGTSNGTLNADGKVEITVASGNNDVILSYSKDTDRRDSASVTVTHIYKTRDYDGSTTEVSRNSYTISYFAGMPFTVSYNTMGGIYPKSGISVTASGEYTETVMQDAVTLSNVVSGDGNSITITYIRDVDTRQTTKVQVTYNYYARDTYTDDDTMSDADYIAQEGMKPEYTVVEILDSKSQGVWVGHEYTAADKPEYTVGEGDEAVTLTYGFVNSTPEGRKIDSLEAMEAGSTAVPEKNQIVVNYLRKYSTDPGTVTYTVVHEYYSSGRFMGSTQSTETGKPGSTVSADDIGKITSFEGRNYSYLSADPETMVLAADGENVMTLRYTRSSGGGGGGGGSTDPDTDPDPGTDIEDPDVPTTDLPDVPTGEPTEPVEEPTEIEEPEVPMAEAPETGDSNFAYLHLLSLASALGLVALFLSDKRSKKHRDEA